MANPSLPVSHEDLPAVHHIAERDAAVVLPLVQDLQVVHEDEEVVGATLVEDLGNGIVGTRHLGGRLVMRMVEDELMLLGRVNGRRGDEEGEL